MNRKSLIQITLLATLILSACGVSAEDSQTQQAADSALALTITAQAGILDALTQTALAVTDTPEPTATASPTVTPAFTDTPTTLVVTVSANTNCRSGPGPEYEIVGALAVGQQSVVLGKNTATGYWIIDNPIGAGTCWLWGEHAAITGNTASLQEFEIPATVTALPALAPIIDRVEVRFDASSGSMIVFLDLYYHDSEGDAILADWQLVSTSVAVGANISDNRITPSPNQRRGSVVTAQWACGTRVYDVALGVTVRDQAGHSINTLSVVFSCNRN